jgi:hypothetical protein
MINRSENITDFCVGMVQNQEIKFILAGPPPLQSSTKGKLIEGRQGGSPSIREYLGG